MNISVNNSNISNLNKASNSKLAASAEKKAEVSSEPSDSYVPSASKDVVRTKDPMLEDVLDYTFLALSGAAAGAISSTAPGYWSVAAGLGSGIVTGSAALAGATAINTSDSMARSFATVGGAAWGGIGGAVAGVATNLLESVTGLPRMATGAITGAVANVALYAFASR